MGTTASPLYSICILVLLACFGSIYCKVEFHTPAELAGLQLMSDQFMFVGSSKRVNVTGRLILSDPPHGCTWDDIKNKNDFENNIVVMTKDSSNPCSPVDKFRTADKGKAAAFVYLFKKNEYLALAGSKYLDAGGIHVGGIQAQAYVKDSEAYDLIVKYAKDDNVTVTATVIGDQVPLNSAYYIVFSILIGIFSLWNMSYAAHKLYHFMKLSGKLKATLPQICLSIEVAANFLRIILCLEPDVGCGRGVIDFGTVSFLQSGSLPWGFISTLLIAFYWDHSLRVFSDKKSPNWKIMSIQKMKIPLIIICAILVLGNLAGSAVQAAFLADRTVAIIVFVYWAICAVGIAIYFVVSGAKVLSWARRNKGNKSANSARTARLSRMTKLIVGTACGLIWTVLSLVVLTLTVDSWFYGYIPLFLGLNFVSSMQIMIFTPGSSVASGTTSGGNTHSGQSSAKNTDKVELPSATNSGRDVSATTSRDVLLASSDGNSSNA